MDVIYLMDDSGSMYGSWGDQSGIRYAAALSAIDWMRRMGGGRAAVVHWGSDAPASQVLPLTNVRRGQRALKNALRIPASLGGNNFPAALDRAASILSQSQPGRIKLIVALTDGIEYLDSRVHSSLARLPQNSVHVLLVDRSGGCDETLEKQWKALPIGFVRLDVLDTRKMALQITDALASAVGLRVAA